MNKAFRMAYIVEDNEKIARLLAAFLDEAGYETRIFHDARGVVDAVRDHRPAVVLLDVMLPAGSGLKICRELRSFSDVPILILSARAEEGDRIEGLKLGADDYVVKPFSPREVVARVEALTRRHAGHLATDSDHKPLKIDPVSRRVTVSGTAIEVSPSEFIILATLAGQPGRVFSRTELLDRIGDHTLDTGDRAIDSHIKNLRRKIASAGPEGIVIKSVYGVGYRLDGA